MLLRVRITSWIVPHRIPFFVQVSALVFWRLCQFFVGFVKIDKTIPGLGFIQRFEVIGNLLRDVPIFIGRKLIGLVVGGHMIGRTRNGRIMRVGVLIGR